MNAVVDVGSNTIRMLLADYFDGRMLLPVYYREITRLAGGFSAEKGLSESAMSRSLSVLKFYKNIISSRQVSQVSVVGTAALRRARNRQVFLNEVYAATGLKIEIIAGEEEAFLTTKGVLSVIDPIAEAVIVLDIGGGSTELICIIDQQVCFKQSYPLGVVRLCEEFSSAAKRKKQIDKTFSSFIVQLQSAGLADKTYQLIGTAGTITTLAAIHLDLQDYNSEVVNNHELSVSWLLELQERLKEMSVAQREDMNGMEAGRGDLILPGLEILLFLLARLQLSTLKVSDSGLLEGVMINLTDS